MTTLLSNVVVVAAAMLTLALGYAAVVAVLAEAFDLRRQPNGAGRKPGRTV